MIAGSAQLDGTGFVEVTEGQDVELVPGAQGGFHVWINVRLQGVMGDHYLRREARRVSDDALVLRSLRQQIIVPEDAMNDWWESPEASPAFMCPSPIGIRVFDEPIRYKIMLFDTDDEEIMSDELTLTPRCPEGEQEAFCLEICAG